MDKNKIISEKTAYYHPSSREDRRHSSILVPYSLYHCRIPEYFPSVPMHWHEEFEIDYILEGEGQIHMENGIFQAKKGDLFLIPPNTLHAAFCPVGKVLHYEAFVFHHGLLGSSSKDRSSVACIYPMINGRLRPAPHIENLPGKHPDMYHCIQEVLTCAMEDQPLSDLLLKSGLLHFFYLLEKEPSFLNSELSDDNSSDLIRPALVYMEEHFRENITIETLAECCSISPSYFMSCFKKTAGTGAIEHLTQLRIMKVCEELLTSPETISEIAFHNGFDNLSNFNRQFQKHVGSTPRQYREINRHTGDFSSPR